MRASSREASASVGRHDDVAGAAERHRRQAERVAPRAHVVDLAADDIGRIAMGEPRVALGGDQRLGGGRLAAGVDRRARRADRLGLQHGVAHRVVARRRARTPASATARRPRRATPPCARSDRRGGRTARRTCRASDAHHDDTTFSDRRPPLMRSMLAACLASSAGRMERRAHRDHDLELRGDRGERGRGAPRVERRRVDALDVIQIEFGDERQIEAESPRCAAPAGCT